MATSIGQYTPVSLPGEPPSLTEKPGTPQSTGLQESDTTKAILHADARFFWPVAALPQWDLSVKVVQLLGLQGPWRCQVPGTRTASAAVIMALSVFFRVSCSWLSQGLFGQSFSIAPPVQALKRAPLPGVLLCCSGHQSLQGAPWVGSYSVVQSIKCFMCQPLYCSGANAGMWGERGYGDGSTSYTWLSSIALLPWLPGLPPQAFPTTVSSLTSPWSISLWSTAALVLRLLHNP